MKLIGRLLPPKSWKGSDGCSSVPDHHYFACCKRHDWGYRHARFVGRHDHAARKLVDCRLRACMKRANRKTAPDGGWARLKHWARWSWRPWVWWITLRLVGWWAWVPIAERRTSNRRA